MTHIRKLVSAVSLVLLCLSYSVCNAQIDQTTGNVITNTWSGTVPGTYGGYSGGYQPGYVSTDRAIVFGYNQGTASQSVGIAAALNAGGAGVELKGYNYSWYYYNNDMNRGTLTGNISLKSSSGNVLESYNYSMPQTGIGNWIPQSGTQLFTNQYQINQVSTLDVSFTGKDDRWWAGYYGPAIKSINVKLMYGVNPCATNPAYSPECAGFDKVVESANLVPNPDAYAVFGSTVDNSFSINQAMKAAGTGINIHGFRWGYVANANGPYCNSWDMGFLGCWDIRLPSVNTNVNITNSAGQSLYNVSRTYTNSYNTTSYEYLFPTSQQVTNLGSFNFTASTYDVAYVGSMWSKAVYTPDPCVLNPLSNPSCPGYLAALGINTSGTTTTTTTVTDPVATTTTTTVTDPVATTNTISQTSVVTNPTSSTTVVDVAAPQTSPTSTTSSSSTTAAATSSTPSATNPQPKIGEVTTAGSQPKSVSSPSTSQLLSIIGSENSRLSKLEMSTAQSAAAQAQAQADQATAEAQATAAGSVAQGSGSYLVGMSSRSALMSNMVLSGTGLGLKGPDSFSSQSSFNQTNRQQQSTNEQQSNDNKTNNQVNNLLTQQPLTLGMVGAEGKDSTVKRNVKDNDAAGGVTIASIAKTPAGYDLYTANLQDRPFYAPKEIYRNQKVVDNARAQRLLNGASDRLHQQMVDQQYNLGQ